MTVQFVSCVVFRQSIPKCHFGSSSRHVFQAPLQPHSSIRSRAFPFSTAKLPEYWKKPRGCKRRSRERGRNRQCPTLNFFPSDSNVRLFSSYGPHYILRIRQSPESAKTDCRLLAYSFFHNLFNEIPYLSISTLSVLPCQVRCRCKRREVS